MNEIEKIIKATVNEPAGINKLRRRLRKLVREAYRANTVLRNKYETFGEVHKAFKDRFGCKP